MTNRPMSRSLVLAFLLGLLSFGVATAEAQYIFPRIGLSASPDEYNDELTTHIDDSFVLYVCVFGPNPGEPIDQDIAELNWVIHQVCCGASLDIEEIRYEEDIFEHYGSPMSGVTSSSEVCVNEEKLLLATVVARVDVEQPGDYLWAAGVYSPALDCDQENAIFMDMPVMIHVEGDATPNENHSWGALKATYR